MIRMSKPHESKHRERDRCELQATSGLDCDRYVSDMNPSSSGLVEEDAFGIGQENECTNTMSNIERIMKYIIICMHYINNK